MFSWAPDNIIVFCWSILAFMIHFHLYFIQLQSYSIQQFLQKCLTMPVTYLCAPCAQLFPKLERHVPTSAQWLRPGCSFSVNILETYFRNISVSSLEKLGRGLVLKVKRLNLVLVMPQRLICMPLYVIFIFSRFFPLITTSNRISVEVVQFVNILSLCCNS